MVARINFSKSIWNIVHYNESKLQSSKAVLLYGAGFGRDPALMTIQAKLEAFRKLTRQNIRSKTNAMHVSLNFLTQDAPSPEKMMQIAGDYMRGIGFGRQPYLVYQHMDAGHPHMHIATVVIQQGGEHIHTHNLRTELSLAVTRELNRQYGLRSTQLINGGQNVRLDRVPLHRLRYGEIATWTAISSTVDQVVNIYSCRSVPQLNAVLNQFGIMADTGRPGTKLHTNGGLIYYLLDEDGKRIGKAIKSGEVYGRPTLKRLEKLFEMAGMKMERGTYIIRLKYYLDKLLAEGAVQAENLKLLHQQGIRIVFNKHPDGHLLGATFIDNGTRSVFNDWELGSPYHHERILGALQRPGTSLLGDTIDCHPGLAEPALPFQQPARAAGDDGQMQENIGPEKGTKQQIDQIGLYPGSELPVIETLSDVLYYDSAAYRRPEELSIQVQQVKDPGLSL